MEYGQPLVTVLMPVFNGEQYLKEAIDSIISQTFTDFELLIIDDGCWDRSVEIIKSYADPRIRLVRNQKNLGLIASLNKGLDLVHSPYIARMDCDDISLPERLVKQVNFMENHLNIGVCGTWFQSFGSEINVTCTHPTDTKLLKAKLFFDCYLGHPTVMIRRELLEKFHLRYSKEHLYAEDYGLWVKCSEFFDLTNIPEVLLLHRNLPTGITMSKRQQQIDTVIKINCENLAKLGIRQIDDTILRLHRKIVIHPRSITSKEEKEKAYNWLWQIKKANEKNKVYDEIHFSVVLAEKWLEICHDMKNEEWGKTLHSTLLFGVTNKSGGYNDHESST